LLGGELPKLPGLILGILLIGRATGVDGDFHLVSFFRGRPPNLPFFRAEAAFALDLADPPSLPSMAAIFEISVFLMSSLSLALGFMSIVLALSTSDRKHHSLTGAVCQRQLQENGLCAQLSLFWYSFGPLSSC